MNKVIWQKDISLRCYHGAAYLATLARASLGIRMARIRVQCLPQNTPHSTLWCPCTFLKGSDTEHGIGGEQARILISATGPLSLWQRGKDAERGHVRLGKPIGESGCPTGVDHFEVL